MKRRSSLLLLPALALVLALTVIPRAATQASEEEVTVIIRDRIAFAKKSVGIVVGLIDEKGTRVVTYGSPHLVTDQPLDGNTVFEIGSITKVFTATLLADMVERGEVSLNDPISKYLPKSVKIPSKDGKEITLLHLTTQTSGLPRLPGNLLPKDPTNPYADYTVDQLYSFLSGFNLTRDPGSQYLYSNLGVGLLGHILSLRGGADYETLVKDRICNPLKMDSTGIKLTGSMKKRLAGGHNASLQPVPNWDIPTLAGAGGLRSTVNDMLKFLAANMGKTRTPLFVAMEKTQQTRHDTGTPDLEIGMGWHIMKKFGSEIVWHNGGTGGYHSFIGFERKSKRGVVILSNSVNDIDDIGRHLLEDQFPLARIEGSELKTGKIDPKVLAEYAGEYQVGTDFIVKITLEGDRLFGQAGNEEKLELFAASPTEFFFKGLDVQISFFRGADGKVSHLNLRQNRINQQARKVK